MDVSKLGPNSLWYLRYWCETGEQHPNEHHYITAKLAPFRKGLDATGRDELLVQLCE